jgi:hypothetical protein
LDRASCDAGPLELFGDLRKDGQITPRIGTQANIRAIIPAVITMRIESSDIRSPVALRGIKPERVAGIPIGVKRRKKGT